VFAIIGWQTMLYRLDTRCCPPAQLAVADETDGYRGQAYFCLRQNQSACQRPLHDFLMGFGLLLPPRNSTALPSQEDKKALGEIKVISAESLNAHLLGAIGGITVKWTDCLACHLELDVSSNTLYLFRYPSFCLVNLHAEKCDDQPKTAIHACAAPHPTEAPWATANEVSQLLHEIILSYRLLFGQNKASRHYFRSISPFYGIPKEGADPVLTALCGRKRPEPRFEIQDRDTYHLSGDFPVLKSRIAALSFHLSSKRPRTWKQLWNDKRDSGSWLTFWAVLIFGGIGVMIAFVQVILQILQVALQIRQS
jgi:hypothetical protein